MKDDDQVARYADMFMALGTDVRLRIMRLLLSAHPEGMVVGDIQTEMGIPNSTTKAWSGCGATAPSSGTPPIPKCFREF
jgi:predicted transcriptional regulator